MNTTMSGNWGRRVRGGWRRCAVIAALGLGVCAGDVLGQFGPIRRRTQPAPGQPTPVPQQPMPEGGLPMGPTDVVAEVVPTGVRVGWTAVAGSLAGYRVYRERLISAGVWGEATTIAVPATAVQYTDVPPFSGQYRYRVHWYRPGLNSRWSAPATVMVLNRPAPAPLSPTGLTAVDAGQRRAVVSWEDQSNNETGFEVERQPPFAGGRRLIGSNVTSVVDDCGPGVFSYRVRALSSAGPSGFSAWSQARVADTVPGVPGNVVAVDVGNERDVRVTWVDNSNNETGFVIERERRLAGGAWGEAMLLSAGAGETALVDQAGTGAYRYRVSAMNMAGQSVPTEWASTLVVGGWTELVPSPDSRLVYVSSSMGADSNSGLSESEPKRTLAAGVSLLRNGSPDWLLLRRGDVWTNESFVPWRVSGRSPAEPVVVWSYGPSAQRPLLKTGVNKGIGTDYGPSVSYALRNIAFVGLEFWSHTYTGTVGASAVDWAMPGSDVLIEDCLIRGYKMGMSISGFSNATGSTIDNVRLRRNIVVDSYSISATHGNSHGIYLAHSVNALVEENLLDHNGWNESVPGAEPSAFQRNFYVSRTNSGLTTRGNISARSSSEGWQQRSGGLCERNLFLKNSTGLTWGHFQATWPTEAAGGVIRNNVILDSRDISPTMTRGQGVWFQRCSGVEMYGNIIAHQQSGTGGVIGIYSDYENSNLNIHNNIVYNWLNPSGGTCAGASFSNQLQGPLRFENNALVFPGSTIARIVAFKGAVPSGTVFGGNRYVTSRTPAQWFEINNVNMTLAQWVSAISDQGSTTALPAYPDPERTMATYMATLGGEPSLEAFLLEARRQSRANWREEYTAKAVVNYVRAGFGWPAVE